MIKGTARAMPRVSEAVNKLESGSKVAAYSNFIIAPDNFHSPASIYLCKNGNQPGDFRSDIRGDHSGRKQSLRRRKMCYNRLMFNRLMMLASLIAVIVILAMINLTTPTGVGPLGVLVFFVMVYVVVFGVTNLVVAGFMKFTGSKQGEQKQRLYAAVISFGPIMLLLIQSFGSLNLMTAAMVIVFVFLGCFIINKRL